MDIITHTLSGVAIGSVAISYSDKNVGRKIGVLAVSVFAAALPDLDVISLWSGFDDTIGSTFGLRNPGKEIYFSKFWYSHHAFLHSLAAAIMGAVLLFLIYHCFKSGAAYFQKSKAVESFRTGRVYFVTFLLAFLIHLIEDMPTPASVWGGVNFFWPSANYIGGTGEIWWWNNYDIFLIVFIVILFNLTISIIARFINIKPHVFTTFAFLIGLILATVQIKTRNYDFNYQGFTQDFQVMEAKSKAIQKEILGEDIYAIMVTLDNKIPLNF